MGHKWIIDVLADLRSFAQENDLQLLAEQLEQTTQVATVEIASTSEERSLVVKSNGQNDRTLFERAGSH